MPVGHAWELTRRMPHPALRGAVDEYQGFRERVTGTLCRREIPAVGITVIINLGPAFGVDGARRSDSFVAGLCTSPSLVETIGEMEVLEARLTPLGARRLFGLPMSEIAERVVALDDLVGREGRAAVARLRAAPTWAERFALLDRALLARLAHAPATPPPVDYAWQRLAARHGLVSMEALAKELVWSPKRLVTTFRDQVGLGPKQVARLFRFQRAVKAMSQARVRLTAIAFDMGYYDQAHLIREVRALSGLAPGELMRQMHPDGPGLVEE
jgi:AraC-like DNA-binding protein